MIDFNKHKQITILYDDVSYKQALEFFEYLKTIIPINFHVYDYTKYIFNCIKSCDNYLIFINNNISDEDERCILHDMNSINLNILNNEPTTEKKFYNDIMILLREIKLKKLSND